MKVLIVSTLDTSGGAARAAYRLHRALLDAGVDSQMLVQSKKSEDETVICPTKKQFQRVIGKSRSLFDSLPLRVYKNRSENLFSPAWLPFGGVLDVVRAIDPDVVHLHWICGGMIRIEDLGRIEKPIVWSLHDMWAFTGGCHYDEGCGKYKSGCSSCPVLGSKRGKDLSQKIFSRKQITYAKIDNLTVVGLSRWLADCASKSLLFADKQIVNLPNPIDSVRFRPVEKIQARMALNLATEKKFVLFGAMSATKDPRKGHIELIRALETMPKSDDTELLIFGSSRPDDAPNCGFATYYLGHLDDESLHLLFCAADVMVVPSLQENLSNAIMESMACGTPVVAFDIGGNRDLIDHKHNGYLAEPFSPSDLAEGINWILNSPESAVISQNARESVLRNFDSKVVAEQYIKLYESLLN